MKNLDEDLFLILKNLIVLQRNDFIKKESSIIELKSVTFGRKNRLDTCSKYIFFAQIKIYSMH